MSSWGNVGNTKAKHMHSIQCQGNEYCLKNTTQDIKPKTNNKMMAKKTSGKRNKNTTTVLQYKNILTYGK